MDYTQPETQTYTRRDAIKLGIAGLAGILGMSSMSRAEDAEENGTASGEIVFYDAKSKSIKVMQATDAVSKKTLDAVVKKVDLEIADLKELRPTHEANVIFALYTNSSKDDAIASIDLNTLKGTIVYQGKGHEIDSIRLATINTKGVESERLYFSDAAQKAEDKKFYEVDMANATAKVADVKDRDLNSVKKPLGKWDGTPGTRWEPKEITVWDSTGGEREKGKYAVEIKEGKAEVTVVRAGQTKAKVLRSFEFAGEPWQLIWMHPDNR